MTPLEAKVVRAAIDFHDAWKTRSIDEPEVYDAANLLMRAVRALRRKPRKQRRLGP